MTSPQERITEAVRRGQDTVTSTVRRGQETVNSTVRTVSDSVQKAVSRISLRTTVPTLEDLVDRSYAFAVQVLSVQRDFTKSLLAYAAPAEDVPAPARPAAKRSGSTAKKNS